MAPEVSMAGGGGSLGLSLTHSCR
eukprot:COSAG06_NODE_57704_length_279_cov_0.988889_1_plen_23_part_10